MADSPAADPTIDGGAWQRFLTRAPELAAAVLESDSPLSATAAHVIGYSDFIAESLCRDPELWPALSARAHQQLAGTPLPPPQLAPGIDETVIMDALRRWRRAEYVRIAWRDLAGWATLDETLADLSHAADAGVRIAHDQASSSLRARFGVPRSEQGEEQNLIVVAMGKLGGCELNFSSDIDLVMLYPMPGETDGARSISNQEFFTRLVQGMVRLLGQATTEGFAFRVDLRLRPFGESGPIVSSVEALEDYLQTHGRDWERYAWIKARAVTNVEAYRSIYATSVEPFVYRRYLDFGVFESLREMKSLIEREVERREMHDNIKLGPGGIREIEFIVQSFQLIRGGQDQRLRTSSLRRVLPLLVGAKLLPDAVVHELDASYAFLRRVENHLQMRADAQTHQLPGDPVARTALAASLGLDNWDMLASRLQAERGRVSEHFQAVVLGPAVPASTPALALEGTEPSAALIERLSHLGYEPAERALVAARLLQSLWQSAATQRLDDVGRRRMTALLPVLAAEAAASADPVACLRRLLRIVEAIGSRSAYLALLLHRPRVRARLLAVVASGDFLADQIAAYPLLLDELIDASMIDHPPDRASMARELDLRMAGLDQNDEERVLERLRQFQRAELFRLAVADLLGNLPVMQVSDRLTDLAELIIEQALQLTWRQLTPQLGQPMCGAGTDESPRREVRIAVIGYGKLGGWELGYSSDLDLVFLHDSSGERQETEGARSIDNQVFFVRFAQRLVHLLSVHSTAGRLYEVDTRLRPSGKGGMLITSLGAFAEYQRYEAWTWEHQALLHARAVSGAPALRTEFEQLRTDILAQYVRRGTLRADVAAMRNRMRQELSRAKSGQVDLKQDAGGIADIEFLAQYWALLWARDYPPVALYSDTSRQLESLGSANLVAAEWIDTLGGAYRAYRTRLHHRALEGGDAVLDEHEFTNERANVLAIWNQVMPA